MHSMLCPFGNIHKGVASRPTRHATAMQVGGVDPTHREDGTPEYTVLTSSVNGRGQRCGSRFAGLLSSKGHATRLSIVSG